MMDNTCENAWKMRTHKPIHKTFIQLMRIISHKISPLFKWNVPTQLHAQKNILKIYRIRKTCNGRSVVVVVVFCEGELDYYFLCSTDGPMCSFAQNSKQSKPLLLLLLPCFIHSYFESQSLSDACLSVRLTSRQRNINTKKSPVFFTHALPNQTLYILPSQ